MPGKERQGLFVSFYLAFLVFILDRLSKILVCKRLFLGKSIPIIKNFFHLTLVYNRGIAFGMFKGSITLSIILSLLAIIMILRVIKEKSKEKKANKYLLSLSLILGGALGNLTDRIFLGYVIDFLDFRIWPVFNLADTAISMGMFFLGYLTIFRR